MNLERIRRGLLKFRSIKLNVEKNGVYYIMRELFDNEAYFFNMEGIKFMTYAKEIEDKVMNVNFTQYFEDKCDYEFALNKDNYKPYINDNLTYRVLDNSDKVIVDRMKKECTKSDLDHGQVSIEDPVVMGAFIGGKLVGIASFWEWEEDLNDIGVLVHPNYRGIGVGISTVSRLIDEAPKSKICIYRADYDNPGSVRIAEKLGFEVVTEIYRYKG